MKQRKKILWQSEGSQISSGFGRNSKIILSYLYKTGKYDVIEYANSPFTYKDKRLEKNPWKSYGSLPTDEFIKEEIAKDPALQRSVNYGSNYIDKIIAEEKPDVFIGIQDPWAFEGYWDKPWWNEIESLAWLTPDSLPLYGDLVDNAAKIKNFWVWSGFAEREFRRLGFDHIKTLPGAFDTSEFKPLEKKLELRRRQGIQDNEVIFGFVFRNQGRKLIGNLLEGYSIFKKNNPNSTTKLLLHTNWSEGWNIPDFIKEFEVNEEEVLTTYICAKCKKYEVKPFKSDREDCKFCGTKHSQTTVKTFLGVPESSMNEIYNLMNFYIHPVTSGGLEMPLVESLLAGIPIATINYSCGEDFCANHFVEKLEFDTYREFGSQFIKANPRPSGIADVMEKFYNLDTKVYDTRSRAGRDWAANQFSVERICGFIEEFLDAAPFTDYQYNLDSVIYNDSYVFRSDIEDDTEWCIDMLKGVFNQVETEKSSTVKKMIENLRMGETRENIHRKSLGHAKSFNEGKKQKLATNYFKKVKGSNLIAIISPDEIEEKLSLLNFIEEQSKSAEIFIIHDEIDLNIFNQSKVYFMPKASRSSQPQWLLSLKDENGNNRFNKVYYKQGKVFVSESN